MQFFYDLRDHAGSLGVFGFLLGVLIYFLVAWTQVGIDPDAGTIIPLYGPPSGISAAEMRAYRKDGIRPYRVRGGGDSYRRLRQIDH